MKLEELSEERELRMTRGSAALAAGIAVVLSPWLVDRIAVDALIHPGPLRGHQLGAFGKATAPPDMARRRAHHTFAARPPPSGQTGRADPGKTRTGQALEHPAERIARAEATGTIAPI